MYCKYIKIDLIPGDMLLQKNGIDGQYKDTRFKNNVRNYTNNDKTCRFPWSNLYLP